MGRRWSCVYIRDQENEVHMPEEFWEYFYETIDYPKIGQIDEILPIGTLYRFVSSTFLNGFINYSTESIRSAFVAARYKFWHALMEDEKGEGVTKANKYRQVIESGNGFHSDLSCLEDDVIVLCKTQETRDGWAVGVWWFYWFDQDVSDCSIGRFSTDDSDEVVVNKFNEMVLRNASELGMPKPLPRSFFSGWVRF
jgi:hypothetical protein